MPEDAYFEQVTHKNDLYIITQSRIIGAVQGVHSIMRDYYPGMFPIYSP